MVPFGVECQAAQGGQACNRAQHVVLVGQCQVGCMVGHAQEQYWAVQWGPFYCTTGQWLHVLAQCKAGDAHGEAGYHIGGIVLADDTALVLCQGCWSIHVGGCSVTGLQDSTTAAGASDSPAKAGTRSAAGTAVFRGAAVELFPRGNSSVRPVS